MRKLFSHGLAVVAGVVSWPAAGSHANSAKPPAAQHRNPPANDPRLACLRNFFGQGNCPAAKLSSTFLEAADLYGLDWRLLPSLSFVETSGGKAAPHNNLFGWDSGRAAFSSAAACVRSVAYSLTHSTLYKGKDIDGILKTYNQKANYGRKVKDVMRRIAPVAD
ncbi:MAG TPA: hypothetical protein VMI94_28500 [Bryobacteraceae bacterium]|nr:hypothetical protein [Bryobacteraceae bacterium]